MRQARAHADRRSDRRRLTEARRELGQRRRQSGEEPTEDDRGRTFRPSQQRLRSVITSELLDKYTPARPRSTSPAALERATVPTAATDYAARRDRDQCDVHERRSGLGSRRPTTSASPATAFTSTDRSWAHGRDVLHAEGSCLRDELHVLDRCLRQARKPLPEDDDHRIDRGLPAASPACACRRQDTAVAADRARRQRDLEIEPHLGWSPSVDNVAVTGYDVSKDGGAAGTTSSTSYLLGPPLLRVELHLRREGLRRGREPIAAATSPRYGTLATGAAADTQAPSPGRAPRDLRQQSTRSRSPGQHLPTNVGVAGYGAYRNGSLAGSTNSTSYTVSGLTCGTGYTLAVDAYDAAGITRRRRQSRRRRAPVRSPQTLKRRRFRWSACDWRNADVDHRCLERLERQRRRGRLPRLQRQFHGGFHDIDLLHRVRPVLRHDLHARGRRLRRSGEPLVAGEHHDSTTACAPSGQALDVQPPTTPAGLHVTSATTSSITVAWTASTDNVGVTGYGLYRSGTSTGTTTSTSATFSGLCLRHRLHAGCRRYDAAGNRSTQATVSSPTSACLPAADTQPPTTPGNSKRRLRPPIRSRLPGPPRPTTSV